MRIPTDKSPKCFEQLLWDISKEEYKRDELYDKIHDTKLRLSAVKHKRSLMKVYLNKSKWMRT